MLIAVGEGSWSRAEKRREVNIEVEMPEKQAGWRSKEKGTAASSGATLKITFLTQRLFAG